MALLVRTTESTFERLKGLLGGSPLREGEALVLEPCNMVHTIGMRYSIDIVFADRTGVVRKVCAGVPPFRMRASLRSRYVVEMAAGEAARLGWRVGTPLAFLTSSERAA